ncbi:hypothetical protein HRI_002328500 [Hibiscus trionum]|uniref:Uncharacterized protein n=1 Tax=Hibiscus trionum TaxID=183268 RepID=A0A9W7I0S1_HIBTR|nr:hypothetical protein HRI_002328500 [Hibiscus trionum]
MEGQSFADEEANESCSAMVSGKVADIHTELKNKDRYIESLKAELGKTKDLEAKLAEKEASFRALKRELKKLKSFESESMDLLSQGKKRIQELEEEIKRRKETEQRICDSFATQSEEYKKSQISLEKSKQEINFLLEILEKSEGSPDFASSQTAMADNHSDSLEPELQLTKDNLAHALEKERVSSLKAERLAEEAESLRSQLKSTIEAEENNKKAMDDLAMALKEVRAEAEQINETLILTTLELDKTKGEVQTLRVQARSAEEKYMEAKKEAELFRNISERLRVEAEESQMAWSGKEKGFVECIRRLEEERNAAQEENKALHEALRDGESKNIKAKEENQKLRDIMKQAITEASVAKEAAGIAREENYQLRDTVAKKDEALSVLSQEKENLRIHESSSAGNIRDLKLLFCEANLEPEDQERAMKQKAAATCADKDDKEHSKKPKHLKCRSPRLNLPFLNYKNNDADDDPKVPVRGSFGDSDSDYSDDPLKGSIFYSLRSPKTPSTSRPTHHRKKSSFTDDEAMNGEEFEQMDTGKLDEEIDRSARKKKALLKRFGDLMRRKSFSKREQALE